MWEVEGPVILPPAVLDGSSPPGMRGATTAGRRAGDMKPAFHGGGVREICVGIKRNLALPSGKAGTMDTPTSVLSHEHRVIERMLVVLETMSDKVERLEEVPPSDFERAVEFVRKFADGCHHAKEEHQLFPYLGEKGIPASSGPIGVMLREHEMGRGFVRGMAEAFERYAAGETDAAPLVVQNARDYVALLKGHIQKEDEVLFPMVEEILDEEDRRTLMERYVEAEAALGEGVHEKYEALAAELEAKYR